MLCAAVSKSAGRGTAQRRLGQWPGPNNPDLGVADGLGITLEHLADID